MANQYESPKANILTRLDWARESLGFAAEYRLAGEAGPYAAALRSARFWVDNARRDIDRAPASTRRRWKAGR